MNQDYARKKYKQKYREVYERIVEDNLREVAYREREETAYEAKVNEAKANGEAEEITTSILAKDILQGKLKGLEEYSLYCVMRSLYQEGIINFRQAHIENELLMSVVKMRYITIIPKIIMLDPLQPTEHVAIYAIEHEDLELLKTIIEAIKCCGNRASIPCGRLTRHTVTNKKMDILEFLIENNYSYDVLAMGIAKKENNQKMLNILLEKSPFLKESYKQAILFDYDRELAKAILKTNRLEVANDDTFIKLAVSRTSDKELVKMLIDAGANVNAKYDALDAINYRACRPCEEGVKDFGDVLTKAIMQQKYEIADLLRQAGAKDREE